MSFDINKPYRAKNGCETLSVFERGGRLYGWLERVPGRLEPSKWSLEGEWIGDNRGNCYITNGAVLDLVNIPEKRTVKVWINVYSHAPSELGGNHPSRRAADDAAQIWESQNRIACIEREITYEVGEGL